MLASVRSTQEERSKDAFLSNVRRSFLPFEGTVHSLTDERLQQLYDLDRGPATNRVGDFVLSLRDTYARQALSQIFLTAVVLAIVVVRETTDCTNSTKVAKVKVGINVLLCLLATYMWKYGASAWSDSKSRRRNTDTVLRAQTLLLAARLVLECGAQASFVRNCVHDTKRARAGVAKLLHGVEADMARRVASSIVVGEMDEKGASSTSSRDREVVESVRLVFRDKRTIERLLETRDESVTKEAVEDAAKGIQEHVAKTSSDATDVESLQDVAARSLDPLLEAQTKKKTHSSASGDEAGTTDVTDLDMKLMLRQIMRTGTCNYALGVVVVAICTIAVSALAFAKCLSTHHKSVIGRSSFKATDVAALSLLSCCGAGAYGWHRER